MVNTESVKYQAYVAGETRKHYIMYRKLLAEQKVVFKLLSSVVFLSQASNRVLSVVLAYQPCGLS